MQQLIEATDNPQLWNAFVASKDWRCNVDYLDFLTTVTGAIKAETGIANHAPLTKLWFNSEEKYLIFLLQWG